VWGRVLTQAERTWLWNSGAGRAYSEIGLAPTPTPTPTATPTITPTPGAKIYQGDLPQGGRGTLEMSFTAGEAAVSVVGIAILLAIVFALLSDRVRLWMQR